MTAIEEMAGMDVLCSDKTGTLTLNKLSVDKKFIEVCPRNFCLCLCLCLFSLPYFASGLIYDLTFFHHFNCLGLC